MGNTDGLSTKSNTVHLPLQQDPLPQVRLCLYDAGLDCPGQFG